MDATKNPSPPEAVNSPRNTVARAAERVARRYGSFAWGGLSPDQQRALVCMEVVVDMDMFCHVDTPADHMRRIINAAAGWAPEEIPQKST